MATTIVQRGVGDLRNRAGEPALIPARMHNGPDENEAAEKLPMSGRA